MRLQNTLCSVAAVLLLLGCGDVTGGNRPAWPAADIEWPLNHTGNPNVKLRIPAGYDEGVAADMLERHVYPKGRPQPSGNVETQLLLATLWPDMGPRLLSNNQEFQVPGGGRVLMILVRSGEVDPEIHSWNLFGRSWDVSVSTSKHVCITPPRVTERAICHDLEKLDVKSGKFGLNRVGVDFGKLPDVPAVDYRHYDDLYYIGNLTAPTTYISCTAEGVEPPIKGQPYIPHCNHRFVIQPLNALVEVSYRRVYLEDWREIQTAVEKLIKSFVIAE